MPTKGKQKTGDTVEKRYQALFDSAHDGMLVVDGALQIRLANKAAAHSFGYKAHELIGQPLEVLLPATARDKHPGYIADFHDSPLQSRQMYERGAVRGLRKDGTEFPLEIALSKINIDDGVEYAAIIRDISEQDALIKELTLQATTDSLTGLANRRVLEERGGRMFALARRHGNDMSVMMIDIDHFKQVNDVHGHATGDRVLEVLADTIRRALRTTDLPSRYGGEEFCVLLPETDVAGAKLLAERLRDNVAENSDEGFPTRVTISVGIASRDAVDMDLSQVIERADKALYDAKRLGRNRVEVIGPAAG